MPILVKNISKSFNQKVIIKDLSIELPDKGKICFFGKTGIGKSLFMDILSGLCTPDNGCITGLENKKISVVFQEDRLLPWLTALENIRSVMCKRKKCLCQDLLKNIGMQNYADKFPDELSGGMRRKIAIARALAHEGDVLLLDEPFNGLDYESKNRIFDIIYEYSSSRLSILVTHNAEEAIKFSDKIYIFGNPFFKLIYQMDVHNNINNTKIMNEYKNKLYRLLEV